MLVRARAVVVDRVAPDRDDPRVPRAPGVGLGEPLRERQLPAPPLGMRAVHDLPEAAAVAVAEDGQVVHVAQLVQQHAARVAQPALEIDDPRLVRVDAARRAWEPGTPAETDRHLSPRGRDERAVGPLLPVPRQLLPAGCDELHRMCSRHSDDAQRDGDHGEATQHDDGDLPPPGAAQTPLAVDVRRVYSRVAMRTWVVAALLALGAASPAQAAGGYSQAVTGTPGLVAYWRLGATAPGSLLGGASLGAHGALSGDTDTSARFDGIDGELQASTPDAATLEGW